VKAHLVSLVLILLMVTACSPTETAIPASSLSPTTATLPPTPTQTVTSLPTKTTTPALSASPAMATFPPTPAQKTTPLPTETPLPTSTPLPPISLSGNEGLIAFYSERDGNAEIYVMNADGSGQTRLTDNAADDMDPNWSPNGKHLVFTSDRDDPNPVTCFPKCNYEIYVMNSDGSEQTRLTDGAAADYHPAWSPDGTQILFVSERDGNQEIYVMDADGSSQRRLTNNSAADMRPTWSPDGAPGGERIAFNTKRDGNWEIYVMNVDGSDQQRLTTTDAWEFMPIWSPDGTEIAFFACDPQCRPHRQDIYVMNSDGSNLRQLTDSPSTVDEDPAWSPDGKKIVFQSDRDGNFEIYSMNADGSDQQRLSKHRGDDYWPAWGPAPATPIATPTPSQGLIAFVSTRDGNGEIYVMDPGGENVRRLTNWRQWDGYPTWSPDGAKIAYYSYLGSKDWVIKVMDADGGNQRQVTDNGICDGAPHWSPDGTHIAYSSDADCTATHREVYVMNVDGSNQTNLTQNDADDMGSSWSPDSQQIVFSSDRDGDYEIYVMDANGGNVRQLTENNGQDMMAAWSPGGDQIAFVSDRDGNDEIYVMDVRGNNVERLTDTPAVDWFPTWSPDGSQVVFNSQRDGNLEIYVMDADGGNVRRLTNSPGDDFNAVWQPSQTQTRVRAVDGMTMVHVPGGTFLMGSTEAQIDIARTLCNEYPDDYGKCKQAPFGDESPQHNVTLDSFWIDRTEVTNAQYALCVADGACRASRLAGDPSYNGDDYPVAGIPWQDAADYCAWAGGRLPTEAEWEFAARGTKGTIFPWGDQFDCAGGNFWDDGTHCDDGYPKPAPVGSFPEGISWCGALDMAGNVWEWVADAYGPYSAEDQVNPIRSPSGSEGILRGGSWGYLPAFVRAAYRYPVPLTADYLAVGFRCVVSAND
jgi:Tol biopolymer transport system component